MAKRRKRAAGGKRRGASSGVARLPKRRSGKRRSVRSMFKSGSGGGGGAGMFSVKGFTSRVGTGAVRAGTLLSGEIGTAAISNRILPATVVRGSAIDTVSRVAVATALGLAAEKVLGRQVGADVLAGGYASVLRSTLRQLGITPLNSVLGDGGSASGVQYALRGGKWVPLNGYVGTGDQRQLSGYVGTGDQRAPALGDEQEQELGY